MTGSGFIHCRDHYWSFSHLLWNYKFKMSTFLLSDSAYWQQWHEKLSTFLDPNTKGSKDHTNASSHSCCFFCFFKNKVLLSDATACVDASKECLQFSNKSQSQGSDAQNKSVSTQQLHFRNVFLCVCVHCCQNEDVSANQEHIQIYFLHQGNPSKLLSFRGRTGILASLIPV